MTCMKFLSMLPELLFDGNGWQRKQADMLSATAGDTTNLKLIARN